MAHVDAKDYTMPTHRQGGRWEANARLAAFATCSVTVCKLALIKRAGRHGKLRAGEILSHVLRVIPALSYQPHRFHPEPRVQTHSSYSQIRGKLTRD